MNLLDLCEVCIENMKDALDAGVNFSDVEIRVSFEDFNFPVDKVQLYGYKDKDSKILVFKTNL